MKLLSKKGTRTQRFGKFSTTPYCKKMRKYVLRPPKVWLTYHLIMRSWDYTSREISVGAEAVGHGQNEGRLSNILGSVGPDN